MAAESLEAPGTVVDGRVPAKGLLPRHLLLYVIVSVALVLMLASAVTNVRATRSPAVQPDKVSSEDPKRMDQWKTQLEADAERARKMAAVAAPKTIVEPTEKTSRPGASRTRVETDGTRDRPAAQTMVLSRRPSAEGDTSRLGGRPEANAPAGDPSTDDIVASILRAKGGMTPTAGVAPSGVSASTATEQTAQVRTPPISAGGPMHLLLEGTILDATLWQKLEGSTESPVKAVLSGPVYSHNRQFVLIPDGTFAIGRANAVQQYNETRLAVSFHRLELPDGSTVPIDQYHGLDQAGDMGLRDQVNNHYVATFGRAAAVGVLQGLGQMVSYGGFGGTGNNRPIIVAGDVGNSTSSAFNTLLNKMPLPTVDIRAGHRLKIYLTSDIQLPAWSRVGETRPVRSEPKEPRP